MTARSFVDLTNAEPVLWIGTNQEGNDSIGLRQCGRWWEAYLGATVE